jgi:hypothetical protein
MKTSRWLALDVLVGIMIGVAGAVAIQVERSNKLPGYVIAEGEVNDLATLQIWRQGTTDSGLFQWALRRSWRRGSRPRRRTTQRVCSGNPLQPRRESARVVRFSRICDD